MNIFGIVKYRRTRKGVSKTGKEYVNYDYTVESINTDSPQSFAFTASELMNGRLKEQGMKDGALGDVFFHTEATIWHGKDGGVDINRVYPTKFKPYQPDKNGENKPDGDAANHGDEVKL